MADIDKTLACADCGAGFVFTAGEREFFRQRGLAHEPKRCKRCRSVPTLAPGERPGIRRRGAPRHLEYAGSPRSHPAPVNPPAAQESFEVTCSHCGALTRLPFRPDGVRPVFCRSCFQDRRRAGPHRA